MGRDSVSPAPRSLDYARDDSSLFLVEFRGTPQALARDEITAAAHRNTFSRFRSDVAPTGSIEHQYSAVFYGAAVRVRDDAVAALRELPYVARVHRVRTVEAFSGEANLVSGVRVNAPSLPTLGKGITIAILDTGVDYTHPALAPGYAGGYDFVNRDADPFDDSGHGTNVAGVAAGVAPEATIVAYKVLNAFGSGSDEDLLAALDRCLDPNGDGDLTDRVDVVNISLGRFAGTPDDPVARAVDNLVAAGVVAVVAAGNGGSIGTIATPGTSRRAITVAATNTAGTDIWAFSSRGPTPGLHTFKPDLAAPGENVVSAKLGGGTVAGSGTSLAAPHVAGAAALLLALHPDWTPEQVKAALVTSAAPMTIDAFARGAGLVDVVAAANPVALVASESGLSFGGNGALDGARTESRRFTITNRGAKAEALALATVASPTGCTATVTPSSLDLAPGQSAEVTVQVAMDNTALRPPSLNTIGGEIVITGTSSVRMPWALVRGARATIRYDGYLDLAVSFGDRLRQAVPLDDSSAELWLPSNLQQDITLLGGTTIEQRRLISVERRIADHEEVTLTKAQATLKLDVQGRDRDGNRLADLPRTDGRRQQWVRMKVSSGNRFFGAIFDGLRELHASALPSRLKIDLAEVLIDVDAMRGYVVQQKSMSGLAASATLSNEPYVHARLRWPKRGFVAACYAAATIAGSIATYPAERCLNGEGETFDLYTTPEPNTDSFVAMLFAGPGFETPPFRASSGAIVATGDVTPPSAAHRIAHGSEASVGTGPFYPLAPLATVPRFVGPLGEEQDRMTSAAYLTIRDRNGVVRAAGSLDHPSLQLPEIAAGDRLQLVASGFVAGRNARNEAAVQFGDRAFDLIAPTITSLQLLGSGGNPTETLRRGDATSLRIAVADYSPLASDLRASSPKSATASFRVSGTREWRVLPATLTGSETGDRGVLKHLASGDRYDVDMRETTALDNVAIDLRVEVEDNAGNRLTWVQEPAFVVGNPPLHERRRAR